MTVLAASIVFGFCFGISAWIFISIANSERKVYAGTDRFERKRRDAIREHSFMYRSFEPVIDELSVKVEDGTDEEKLTKLADTLATTGESVPWKAGEFMATKMLEGFFTWIGGTLFFIVILQYSPFFSVVAAAGVGTMIYYMGISSAERKSKKRRRVIKRDFAAAVDLLALMMEVGGGFIESLKVVAKEFNGKSLGEELQKIVDDIDLGKTRVSAMDSFAHRMVDDDISEVVFACNESEELGVPISQVLRTQADRIRQKRSSWAEQAAQEAEVSLTFPAMIIMIACLITVGAPFVLQLLGQSFAM